MKTILLPRRALMLASAALAAEFASAATPVLHLAATPANTVDGFFSADTPPVLKIKSGDTVEIDTVNAAGVRDDDPEKFFRDNRIPLDLPAVQEILRIKHELKPSGFRAHLMTGPIYVEGALPGDTLEVRVVDVKSRAPYGVNAGSPGRGAVPDLVPRPYQKVIPLDLERQVAKFSDRIEVPLRPFQGVMGIAPPAARGRVSSIPPYPDLGGNMDNKYLGRGATIYYPVQTEGALFQTGDPHAAQGNGEVSITAIEASNTVTLQFIVRKDLRIKTVRAETPTHYILMGFDGELTTAMRMATTQTLDFLQENQKLDFFDALSLASIAVDFEVTQVVDQTKGIHAMVPKSLFKDGSATGYWYRP